MKIVFLSLALALTATASAIPGMQIAPKLSTRDVSKTAIDCNYCFGMLNFCYENGHTHGQEGCKESCRQHVCHRTPECRGCGGELDKCPSKSRFVH